MRRLIGVSAICFAIAGVSAPAAAEGWDALPVLGDNYSAKPTLALIGGAMDPDFSGADTGAVYGVELSLDCPLLQPPVNRIRQQLSLTHYNDDVEITSLEINPHYVMPLVEGLELGFGPGLGVLSVDTDNGDETVFGLQAGASLHYRAGPLFLGAEARYQATTEGDFGAGDQDVNNARYMVKAGVNF